MLKTERDDVLPDTRVAYVNANGQLCYGTAVETFYDDRSVRRVRIKKDTGEGTVCPHLERVAIL